MYDYTLGCQVDNAQKNGEDVVKGQVRYELNGKPWKWVGYLEVLTGFLITGYYAVVSGWCLQYIYASIMGELHGDPAFVANYFKEFSSDPVRPVMWTVAIFLICHFVIIHGVRGGIEKASKIMMPILFILLLIIVVAACLLPDAGKGVEFLLKPDFVPTSRSSPRMHSLTL